MIEAPHGIQEAGIFSRTGRQNAAHSPGWQQFFEMMADIAKSSSPSANLVGPVVSSGIPPDGITSRGKEGVEGRRGARIVL